MPSQFQSVSPVGVAGGVLVAAVAVALAATGYYRPGPIVGVSIAFLALVVGLRGVKPFGDTVAYHLLQAVAFGLWGLAVIVEDGTTVVPVVFAVVGLLGLVHYGRVAFDRGIWTPRGR